MSTFIEVLADKLLGALPARTTVQRRGAGFLSREKRVSRIAIDLGQSRYELSVEGGSPRTTVARAVRGIVLKTEAVSLDDWIQSLSRDLSEQARKSDQARLALERLLGV
jgi:hypothetical protein